MEALYLSKQPLIVGCLVGECALVLVSIHWRSSEGSIAFGQSTKNGVFVGKIVLAKKGKNKRLIANNSILIPTNGRTNVAPSLNQNDGAGDTTDLETELMAVFQIGCSQTTVAMANDGVRPYASASDDGKRQAERGRTICQLA